METLKSITLVALIATSLISCKNNHTMGSFEYDSEFFKKNGISTIELTDGKDACVMVIPAYQGRVMTSSASGREGDSFGWINYGLISSGEVKEAFNPVGGEERFWFGPEGGKFSYYFKKGDEQVYSNRKVPSVIDTETYEVVEQDESSVTFAAEADLTNASDNRFRIGILRKVALIPAADVKEQLGIELGQNLKCVAYTTINTITNNGEQGWNKETGMPSVWMLGMFNPTETTTVFIPYYEEAEGVIVNDEYFGKVPGDRLFAKDGVVYFKIDGRLRSKIGLPAGRAKDICGSYDSARNLLTILKYTVPEGDKPYMNGQWGEQDDAFCGDVINSYNDGPTETGYVMGPFYEIETSSPGAALQPGESLTHTQYVLHIQGDEAELNKIVKSVFGVEIETIKNSFKA